MAPLDRPHTSFYWHSMVNGPVLYRFRYTARYW